MMFRLMTYNIRHGGRGREAPIAAVINACTPDLVLLQEAIAPRSVERIAAATGMEEWRAYDGQSLGFLSRTRVALAEWTRPRVSRHAFVEVVPASGALRVFGVHLAAVHAAWTEQRRLFELRALLRSVARHQDGFHVLSGDFNTLAPGEKLDVNRLPLHLRFLAWIGGQSIRWQTIQVMLDAHYVDAYRSLHPLDPGHTFPTWDPHLRLDYAFLPESAKDRLQRCDVLDGPNAVSASDHLPLLVEFEI